MSTNVFVCVSITYFFQIEIITLHVIYINYQMPIVVLHLETVLMYCNYFVQHTIRKQIRNFV